VLGRFIEEFRRRRARASGLGSRYCTISLSALIGIALTFLLAGLAAIVMGSLVKGLIPSRSLVAGFFTALSLSRR
jgi:hypothetical protein